jgi:hypothetical protein
MPEVGRLSEASITTVDLGAFADGSESRPYRT